MSPPATVHASVALIGEGGVLIRGPSGSGKSSLLLSLLADDTAALVADDRVALAAANGRLIASVPDEIAGLMEIRGQGIVRRPHVSPVVVDLVVDLAPVEACPRLPLSEADGRVVIAGVTLPRVHVAIGAADGAVRVRAALAQPRRETVEIA
jgi:HPr kinase/phosphorylase